jgi:hypothetical protein
LMEQSVTRNSFILMLVFCSACGPQVNISNSKLESNSSITAGEIKKVDQQGTLIRGKPDVISGSSGTLIVSMYSSYHALEFIAAKPMNSKHEIKYRGIIKKSEVILEVIETK